LAASDALAVAATARTSTDSEASRRQQDQAQH